MMDLDFKGKRLAEIEMKVFLNCFWYFDCN